MEFIGKLDRAVAKVEEIILALLLVSMVVLASLQVLLRNIWNTGIDWAEPSLKHATLLIGLLGAAIATSEGRHLNIDLVSRLLSGRKKRLLQVLIGVFAVVMSYLLLVGSLNGFQTSYAAWKQLVPEGWSASKMLFADLSEGTFSTWNALVILPPGFALILFHFSIRLIRDVGSLASGEDWDTAEADALQGDDLLDEMVAKADADEGDEVLK